MNGLFGSAILEVALGVLFVYLLLAVFCTTVNEWIASLLSARAGTLKHAIGTLLSGQLVADGREFLKVFYDHPVITGMMRNCAHPSYLPARQFSTAIMDLSTPAVRGSITFADLEAGLLKLPEGDVRTSLLAVIQNARGDLARAQLNIENWFNDAMDRASDAYRKRAQLWTAGIATALTLAVNADTLGMLRRFWVDPVVRSGMLAQAAGATLKATDAKQLDSLGQVFGWHAGSVPQSAGEWGARLTGWMLTIVAVSLGAPFWFDLLNRFMNLRGSAKPATDGVPAAPAAPTRTEAA